MKRKQRKAFTIVELVIVIAVIGVLTAVLIPTFVNLTNKAQLAENQTFVKNINTQLAINEAEQGKNKTAHEAIMDAFDMGFDVRKLTPVNGNDIIWDEKNDRFAIVAGDFADHHESDHVVYADTGFKTGTGVELHKLWKLYESNDIPAPENQKYSIYAKGSSLATPVNVAVGFDAGENAGIPSVSYVSNAGNDAVIRTNGGYLTINAPSGTVNHYGEAEILDIQAINTASYHEFGKAGLARLKQGHFVVEAEGVVNVLYATGPKSGDTRVVVDNNNGTIGKAYATVTETANIYNGDVQEGQSGNVTLEKYDAFITEAVVTAMNSESIVEVLASEDSSVSAVKETIEAAVESSAFLGEGTEANPYIISSVNDLVKLSQKVAGGKSYEGEWFALSKNIDMKDVLWGADQGENTINCIGLNNGTKFSGNFDGKGYTISNLSNGDKVTADTYTAPTSQTTGNIFGLFGYVSGNVTIKNLTLTINADVPAGKACGGLISNVVAGSTLNISGVTVSGNLYARNEKAAGFIGTTNSDNSQITLNDCVNYVNIKTKERGAGFISQVGSLDKITFNNCQNKGNVSLTKTNDIYDAIEYGVAAGFIAHGNNANISYDEKCTNEGIIGAPLTANFHTYAGAVMYQNNTWVATAGRTDYKNVHAMKGIIITESTKAYAEEAEKYLQSPNSLDGIYYNSNKTYGIVFNKGNEDAGADSKFESYDDMANAHKSNWTSGCEFTLQNNQTCSKTISVAGGGHTYKADLNGYTLSTSVEVLSSLTANNYTMSIKNGTISINSDSTITSLFGASDSDKLILTNVTIVNSTNHAINVNGTSVEAGNTVVIGATN